MLAELYKLFCQYPEVSTDSRDIKRGCLFFALKGERFDGNAFALQALEEGAAYAIVDDAALPADDRLIRVENVLISLQELANYHRHQLGIPIIAITGTNGKTTTKELMAKVLSLKYTISVTKGNFNNHIGVPLTLLRMDAQTQLGVVEMGANHIGEIAALCRIAEPDYGLITNVGKAHLEGFGSLDGVKKAKGELYDFLQSTGGRIFYNSDNPILCEMLRERGIERALAYGIIPDEVNILPNSPEHPFLRLAFPDNTAINTQLIGNYNADNVLAALAVGRHFEISRQAAKLAIENYVPLNNRSQLIRTATNTVIMDAYNANPTSMRAAIENFARQAMPDKWVILGDMKELGQESDMEHRTIIDLLKEKQLNNVLLVGNNFKQAAGDFPASCFATVQDLMDYLATHPLQRATILIKGSHSTSLEKLASYL